jgi:hypothetical protein
MSLDSDVDLFARWLTELAEPAPDVALLASLEATSETRGWAMTTALDALTAAPGSFNPDLHPRGRDGKFIEKLGLIELFDVQGLDSGQRAKVTGITPDVNQPGNPNIGVQLVNPDGSPGRVGQVKPYQIQQAPEKARIVPPPPPSPGLAPPTPDDAPKAPEYQDLSSKMGRWVKGKVTDRAEERAAEKAAEAVEKAAREAAEQADEDRGAALEQTLAEKIARNPLHGPNMPAYQPYPLPDLDRAPQYPVPPTLQPDPKNQGQILNFMDSLSYLTTDLGQQRNVTRTINSRNQLNELRKLNNTGANDLALQQYALDLARFSQEETLYERMMAGDENARWMLARRRAADEAHRLTEVWGRVRKDKDRRKYGIPSQPPSVEQVLDYWGLPWQMPAAPTAPAAPAAPAIAV